MSRLKSSCDDLDEIAGKCMLVRHIAEPLASFDKEQSAQVVRQFMDEKFYDVVGVRHRGVVGQYVTLEDLHDDVKTIGEKAEEVSDDELIEETSGIKDALERLCEKDSPLFVAGRNGHIWGIISRGDLRKAPVSMYLFGLVSLLEMQITRLIGEFYPKDTWENSLGKSRQERARKKLGILRQNNEHIDLVNCLEFCDKREIVERSPDLLKQLAFRSKTAAEDDLVALEKLRNNLAHGQDFIKSQWSELASLVKKAEELLRKSEVYVNSGPPAEPVLLNA